MAYKLISNNQINEIMNDLINEVEEQMEELERKVKENELLVCEYTLLRDCLDAKKESLEKAWNLLEELM